MRVAHLWCPSDTCANENTALTDARAVPVYSADILGTALRRPAFNDCSTGNQWMRTIFVLLMLVAMAARLWAGPPFVTDDPEPVDYLHWEFYLASAWEFAQHTADGTLPHAEFNYGIWPDVQLHLIAPVGYVWANRVTRVGYSDTEMGVKYRFLHETSHRPQVGIFPLLEIPTGDQSRDLGNGVAQVFLPVWLQKSWGPYTSYGGGGFWYFPGSGNKNWVLAGWELQRDLSRRLTVGGEVFYQTADSPDAKDGAGFNVGGFINLDQWDHVLFSVGHSIFGDQTTTAYLGWQIARQESLIAVREPLR
jgi:hypothetical protein